MRLGRGVLVSLGAPSALLQPEPMEDGPQKPAVRHLNRVTSVPLPLPPPPPAAGRRCRRRCRTAACASPASFQQTAARRSTHCRTLCSKHQPVSLPLLPARCSRVLAAPAAGVAAGR